MQQKGDMSLPTENSSDLPGVRARIDELVQSLTIEERAQLTSGADIWHAGGIESIGLAPMLTLDGPNGVRGPVFPPGSSATCTPCGSGLAATWDAALVAEVAARIGLEAKRAGISYMLGPVINIIRSPLAGRDFECFSEDPFLTAQIAVAYVGGMQSAGVAACPKHLVANDSEAHRRTVSCVVDERTLREVYLLPFEAVARAGAWSMMAAYNRLNGVYGTENGPIINGIVREEWGWDGVIVSDWHATHDTLAAARAGLDLEMPGPPLYFGPPLAAAVRNGEIDEAALNESARRILRLAARVGALRLDGGAGTTATTATTTTLRRDSRTPQLLSDASAAALVRRAAAESFVLLTNDGIVPLAPAGLRRVAVLGPNAAIPCTQGGGAANIDTPYAVSPLDGLRAALPKSVEIVHERGCTTDLFLPPLARMNVTGLDGEPGLTLEIFRGQEPAGTPVARLGIGTSEVIVGDYVPHSVDTTDYAYRLSAWLTPSVDGGHRIGLRGMGGRRLFVDGAPAADEWDAKAGVDMPAERFENKERLASYEFEAGKQVLVVAEGHSNDTAARMLIVGCAADETRDDMAAAVAAAASAEVAIVVVGNDDVYEAEGHDRNTVTLAGRQDELVERVLAANPRTVVVVNAGCPMDLPWADKVAAVIYAWLPGQEFGHALADVLLGLAEPGGRLPVTLARNAADYPAYDTTPGPDEKLVYSDGVNVGYRGFEAAGIAPRFAFGHGLGYTTFEYESLELSAEGLADGEPLELRVRLHNSGSRSGKEVVQVYLADLESSVCRPPHELKGFAVVRLEPEEAAELTFTLEDRDLAYWDVDLHSWRIEPGRFEVQVGRSSMDIRLRGAFELD
jgi:beta-glucosidase